MFEIYSDTSANLPTSLAQEQKINIIPFSYFIDEKEHICENTQEFDGKAFFDSMRGGQLVTTSQVTPQRYIDHMKPALSRGKDILFVGLSSGVSGSFHSAEVAAAQLLEEFPQQKIILIDSLGASLGEGMLALCAAESREKGLSIEETAEVVRDARDKMYQVFTVDDLTYLKRSGRLSNLSAFIGSLLNIKPLLKGSEEGKIVAFAKLRGRKRSLNAIAEKYDQLVVSPETQTIGIAHADCPEDAEYLIRLLNKNNPPKAILNVCYEPVTGSHVGPGTLALFFRSSSGVRYL